LSSRERLPHPKEALNLIVEGLSDSISYGNAVM
jgi:hypothetical protein